jgi:hypothetical protein
MAPRKQISDERLALFEKCLEEGWSFHQIILTHQTSWETLAKHFPGRGMAQTEGAKLGALARRVFQT